jgi:hypothetical protein
MASHGTELIGEGVIRIEIVHGQVIVTLYDAILECTQQELIDTLRA